jgi:hypothetical protein
MHWTETITTRPDCPNCGYQRVHAYCPSCGQKQLQERLKFSQLLKSLVSRMTDIESGLFHTFWNLCLRPGKVARDYVTGIQRPYVNPLTYFFLAATMQILAFWSIETAFREQLGNQFGTQLSQASTPENLEKAEKLLGSSLKDVLVDSYVTAISQGYSYLALIFFVIPFAFMLWMLHGAIGEKFRMGETMIFSIFVFSQILLVTAGCTPFTFPAGSTVHMLMAISVYTVVPQLAHGSFFARTWASRLMTLLAVLFSVIPFVGSIIGILLVSFSFRLLWATWQ